MVSSKVGDRDPHGGLRMRYATTRRSVPRALPRCRRRGEHKVAQKEYSCIERYPETVPKFA
jgi:hypothetical protein